VVEPPVNAPLKLLISTFWVVVSYRRSPVPKDVKAGAGQEKSRFQVPWRSVWVGGGEIDVDGARDLRVGGA